MTHLVREKDGSQQFYFLIHLFIPDLIKNKRRRQKHLPQKRPKRGADCFVPLGSVSVCLCLSLVLVLGSKALLPTSNTKIAANPLFYSAHNPFAAFFRLCSFLCSYNFSTNLRNISGVCTKNMHILILGGTSFLGTALCAEAISRGHRVTLLNRGTKPAPMGTTSYVGDRRQPNGLDALDGLTFDAVIDTWGRDPTPAVRAMEKLKGRTAHWTYTSTISVYYQSPGTLGNGDRLNGEDTQLCEVVGPNCTKSVTSFHKRAVEVAAENILRGTPTVFARMGIMSGPREASYIERSRLPWWLDRIRRGGPTLAPGPKDMKMQLIDVRDVAKFIIDGSEQKRNGPYNVCGNAGNITFGDFLEFANELTGNHAEFVWTTPDEIAALQIRPFIELPLWVSPSDWEYATVYAWDNAKAVRAGLQLRSIQETIRDTWAWMTGDKPPVHAPRGVDLKLWRTLGMYPEKEAAALRKLEIVRKGGSVSPPRSHQVTQTNGAPAVNGFHNPAHAQQQEQHPDEIEMAKTR